MRSTTLKAVLLLTAATPRAASTCADAADAADAPSDAAALVAAFPAAHVRHGHRPDRLVAICFA